MITSTTGTPVPFAQYPLAEGTKQAFPAALNIADEVSSGTDGEDPGKELADYAREHSTPVGEKTPETTSERKGWASRLLNITKTTTLAVVGAGILLAGVSGCAVIPNRHGGIDVYPIPPGPVYVEPGPVYQPPPVFVPAPPVVIIPGPGHHHRPPVFVPGPGHHHHQPAFPGYHR